MSTSKRAIAILAFASLLLAASPAFAQPVDSKPAPIITEIVIPGTPPAPGEGAAGTLVDLAQYIGIVYNFLIGIIGMLAAVMFVIAGFQYVTSAGDQGKIKSAKTRIMNALIGLILALGAYTLLNTINPALLTLKVPGGLDRKVGTEVTFLPWCEILMDEGKAVTPVGSTKECGAVGKYKIGNSDNACIFSGSCRARKTEVPTDDIGEEPDDDELNTMWANCTQKASLDSGTLLKEAAKDPEAKYATCLYCAQITKKMAEDLGYDTATACHAWALGFEALKPKTYSYEGYTFERGFFHYCGAADSGKYCVGAAINCMSVTRNEDDSIHDYVSNGCEGYDEDPSPSWPKVDPVTGYAKERYNYDEEGLEDYPDHLGGVCYSNPCQNFHDPASGLDPFLNGCKSGNGLVYGAQRLMRKGDFSPDDCRNR